MPKSKNVLQYNQSPVQTVPDKPKVKKRPTETPKTKLHQPLPQTEFAKKYPKAPDIPDETFIDICSIYEKHAKEGIFAICRNKGISVDSFYNSISKSPVLAERYARAKRLKSDIMSEYLKDIAESPVNERDSAAVQHLRLKVDTYKWIASKLNPRDYGDYQQIEVKGEIQALIGVAVKVIEQYVPPVDRLRALEQLQTNLPQ